MADSRNPHGSFIWYELLTADPDAAAGFYGDAIGWTAAGAYCGQRIRTRW